MRNRALQLVILVVLGGALGVLLTRNWRSTEPAAAVPAPTVEPAPAVTPAAGSAPNSDLPSAAAREFKLPAMPPPLPEPVATSDKEPTQAKAAPATVRVPRFWLLRGTSSQDYDLTSDNGHVKSGEASVLIKSHASSLPLTLNGTVMQSVRAESLLGKRIEVSAFLRAEDVREQTVAIWLTALDSNNLLLALESSQKQFPKVTEEWARVSFVIDVPWSAAQVNYGLTLSGKGAVWMDDFRLTTVDRTVVAPTSTAPPRQLGQRVEMANPQGPLTRPENLDFEEITDVPAPPREKVAEDVTSIRQ